jgi:cell division protein FtsB
MPRLSITLRREWPSLILGAILAALVGNALLGANGPRDLLLLRQRRGQLEVVRAKLMAREAELETNVQNLRSNDRYLEHLIRRELGYVRSDELIYKFTGPPPATP